MMVLITIKAAKLIGTRLEIEFNDEKIFNASTSDKKKDTEESNKITIQVSCDGSWYL